MNVFIAYDVSYDHCNEYYTVAAVFIDELDAMTWVAEADPSDETSRREYRPMKVLQKKITSAQERCYNKDTEQT